MDILIALLLLASALVFVPGSWSWFVSVLVTTYSILKILGLIGGQL